MNKKNKIIYYVAVSLDGYISGPNDDISAFGQVAEQCPDGLAQYKRDLQDFSTVIMGRKTYELGYKYGLEPGQAAYPHMEHHIFSESLQFEQPHEKVHLEKLSLDRVREIRDLATPPDSTLGRAGSQVYLCGGGEFAGWLLDHGLIDQLKLKINPIVLGGGTPLFGQSKTAAMWRTVNRQSFEGGLTFITYDRA